MKVCAACHEDLPKESFSKKQWKLDKYQRRCKVCVTNNREVQLPPSKHDNNNSSTNEVITSLDSMYLEDVKNVSDEELFKQPPPDEDCPICFLLLPTFNSGRKYYSCCGKRICSGCVYAVAKTCDELCPFCRTPAALSDKENMKRLKKLVEANDPIAMFNVGNYYRDGENGYPQDYTKALELYLRAGELGNATAYNNLGFAYEHGRGVEVDKNKAIQYYELAAIMGDGTARHNLGNKEARAGYLDRALKHYMIAVRGGYSNSLNIIKLLYSNGEASKEDYTKALQAYQEYLGEIKSRQRDEAAAFDSEKCRYY